MRATEGHEGVRQRWDVYMRKVKAADSDSGYYVSVWRRSESDPVRSSHESCQVPGVNGSLRSCKFHGPGEPRRIKFSFFILYPTRTARTGL